VRLTLNKRAEYGVRLVMYLADQASDQRMTAAHLAEECQIPAGNVPTIMSLLSRAGVLDCSPGRAGGCMLARPPEEISALEIVEALEGPMEIAHCLLDSRRCHGKDPECAVHHAWSEGRDAAIAALARLSLADAVRHEREIAVAVPGGRPRRAR
jgi:Rrf2 family protein